jgi:hypothetical protein
MLPERKCNYHILSGLPDDCSIRFNFFVVVLCSIFFLLSSSTVVLCQDPALAAPAPAPIPVPVQSGDNSVRGFRTIVTYLGTDFVMPDGCPLPACGETRQDRDCRKQKLDIKQKYDECLA